MKLFGSAEQKSSLSGFYYKNRKTREDGVDIEQRL